MSWFDKIDALCRSKGAPENWHVSVSSLEDSEMNYYKFEGAVFEPYVIGPKKGTPNYKKPIEGTQRTYIFEAKEVRDL